MSRRTLEYAAPETFTAYGRNARTHSEAQIASVMRSITEFGFTNPLLVDEKQVVIAGHCRLTAAQRLGLAEVPYLRLTGLTAAQRRALVLADNQLAISGSAWDMDLLRLELGDLRESGFDLSLTGFNSFELADVFATRKGLTDPDDAPALEERAVTKLGDVWLLGQHRLMCGDSTAADQVARLLKGSKPHLMVTDPPYGVNYDAAWRTKAGVGSKGAAVGKVQNDDRADWSATWALFPGSVAYVWHGGLHSSTVEQSLAAAKFKVRSQIIWVKTRPVLSRGAYHWQHEPCFYATQDGAQDQWRFVPEHEVASYLVRDGETAQWAGDRKQSTVWNIEHIRSETGHSTQKPIECMRRPLENNSKPSDLVYEPFCGSGTTLIAAEMTGRVALAMELSPNYCDVIVKRWQAFTGKQALLDDTAGGIEFETMRVARLDLGEAPAAKPARRAKKAV